MEEDEILETVEEFLDGQRQYNTKTGETIKPYSYSGSQRFVWGNEYVAIQGLLDLYKQEKEKNKELEKQDKIIDLMAKHIEDELTDDICNKENCYADEYINGHCQKCLNCIKQYFEKKTEEV